MRKIYFGTPDIDLEGIKGLPIDAQKEAVKVLMALETKRGKDFTTTMPSWFHEGQKEIWDARERVVLALCGSQSGKTSVLPELLLREIQCCGPGDYAVIGPNYPLLSKKTMPIIVQTVCYREKLGKPIGAPAPKITISDEGMLKLFGSTNRDELIRIHGEDYVSGFLPGQPLYCVIHFVHTSDSDALESSTFKAAFCDESGQKGFSMSAYEALGRRVKIARGKTQSKYFKRDDMSQGRIVHTTTPYEINWLKYEVHDRAVDKIVNGRVMKKRDPNYRLVSFESIMNPEFDRKVWDEALRDMPSWRFEMMHRGRFTRPAGVIYDCFEADKNTCERFPIPDDWLRHVGCDYGTNNTAAVCIAQEVSKQGNKAKRYYLYGFYGPTGGCTVQEHVEGILSKVDTGRRPDRCVGGQPDEQGWRDSMTLAGLPTSAPLVRSVEVGIQMVYSAIKRGELIVFKDMEPVIAELLYYSRELDSEGNVTDKIADKAKYHLMDALRYIGTVLWREHAAQKETKTSRRKEGLWGFVK